MAIELNHIIVPAKDKKASAEFLAGILGLTAGDQWGPFVPLQVSNGVTLDFMDAEQFTWQHCAFLVDDEEFDAAYERIKQAGITYWADPQHTQRNEINHDWGGRGLYFEDPNGHNMEILTKPYGSI